MNGARWTGLAAAVALLGTGAAALLLRDPGLPSDSADGAYVHDCCGTIVLKNGEMVLNGAKTVGYVVDRDESGPYILTDKFVGTWEERGFEIDGSRPPLKMHLDTIPRPSTIKFSDVRTSHLFKRKPPPVIFR